MPQSGSIETAVFMALIIVAMLAVALLFAVFLRSGERARTLRADDRLLSRRPVPPRPSAHHERLMRILARLRRA
jgi:hypothetical protein